MPQVLVPGVAQTVLRGNIEANAFAMIWHWHLVPPQGNWIQTQIQLLADQTFFLYGTHLAQFHSAQWNFTHCDAVDLGQPVPAAATSTGPAYTGGKANPPLTNAACFMINYHIAARYRGGHPRTYLPGGVSADSTDGDTWLSATVGNVGTSWAAFVSALSNALATGGGITLNQCVPLYTYTYTDDPVKHKWRKQKSGLKVVMDVQKYTVSNQIRSQRRRLGR